MPIYEYICKECGRKFEALRAMGSADAPIPCKQCESLQTHRVLSTCYAHGVHQPSTNSGGCSGCAGGSCSNCSR